ncbi:MAG: TolC family protein [Bacteroidetes bacterium]|nr:TolC family protein [Bacteroidota bacterium]
MKRLLALFILCMPVLLSYAQQAAPTRTLWTLEECLHYASENNISVLQADLYKRMSQNNYLQSKLALMPTISANASYNFNFGNSINPTTYNYVKQNSQSFSPNLQGNLNLWTGLQQIHNIEKNKYDLQATSFDLSAAVNNTVLNVTNIFLQLVVNKELVKVAQKQVDISQNQLDQQSAKIRAGTMPESSIYDFQAQLARDQASLSTQKNAEMISNITLKIALQLPDDQAFDIITPEINVGSVMTFDNVSAHDIYQYALGTQPTIQAAQARVTSAMYSIKIAKGALSPTISLSAFTHDNWFNLATQPGSAVIQQQVIYSPTGVELGYIPYTTYSTRSVDFPTQFKNNLANGFSFNLSVPILSGWQRMTNMANSKLQMQMQKLNLQTVRNNLERDIYQSYANAKGNAETYSANLKALEASEKAFETANKRYTAGLATNYDLEISKSNLSRAQSSAVQAKYNYIFSVKVLDFYEGKPITLN